MQIVCVCVYWGKKKQTKKKRIQSFFSYIILEEKGKNEDATIVTCLRI